MPLLVEQLIYTSFSKIGFKCLASDQVPLAIKRAFSEQIVNEHWDTYDPPGAGFRAAYLHQFSGNQTLFGWLYNDGSDDFGRSNIPYFICYYLGESLTPFQLEKILNCLETGPVERVDRRYPPSNLENVLIPDFCLYETPMRGVSIISEIRKQANTNLKEKKLINLFVVGETQTVIQDKQTTIKPQPTNHQLYSETKFPKISHTSSTKLSKFPVISSPTVLDLPSHPEPENSSYSLGSFSAEKLEKILQEFITKPIGIEGVVLISGEGHPIIPSMGLDDNSALIIAGTMIYLAKSTEEELNWQPIETVSLKSSQGHIILAACNSEIFLLVKAGKAVTGLLEAEIKRTIKKLNMAMEEQPKEVPLPENPLEASIQSLKPQPLPELTSPVESLSPQEIEDILEEFGSEEVSLELDTELDIRYRGRKTNQ
ncbi:Roadblock/LC7 family protein [Gloeothece citriformis PCC 7424]|uniref:Roadblock/LC7 family protein n=1 Tax=Gloeothece citriformis (strain PCC 7424) TaxID=65393 RepID=B7K6X9_GLOC7|nr:dynein regulation protein LC7 [Gloeothece citriformis]ACK72678.1 Roadblock/LC7 family protein [Gloeothece citriformis PCC 7424]